MSHLVFGFDFGDGRHDDDRNASLHVGHVQGQDQELDHPGRRCPDLRGGAVAGSQPGDRQR